VKTAVELAKELYAICPGPLSLATSIERRDAEWCRLVEEAQADNLKLHVAVNDGALKIDRLKGELAEARRLISAAPVKMRGGAGDDEVRRWTDARDLLLRAASIDSILGDKDLATDCRTFLAATPAEQAQGEAAKPKSSQSKYPCQFDSEGRCEWHVHDDKPLMLAVAEVAKRVEALESWRNVAAPPPPPDYSHHHTFRQWEREGWPDRCGVRVREGDDPFCCQPADWYGHIKPAPPPPEAAGPGHVFSCDVAGKDDGECDDSCICEVCDVRFDCHAVPPIAGGANP
jgi:hypothetical protein